MEYGNYNVPKTNYDGLRIRELERFLAQPLPMARIKCDDKKAAYSMYNSYHVAIKRKGYPVRVLRRGATVYLAKEEEE